MSWKALNQCHVGFLGFFLFLLFLSQAYGDSFVPPVHGPIKYSPCPVDEGTPFNEMDPKTWYTTVWSGRYAPPASGACEGTGGHPGVDIRDAYGQKSGDFGVYSIGDGTLIKRGCIDGCGNTIVIRHEWVANYGTVYAAYAHLDSFTKRIQQGEEGKLFVRKGEKIGTMGGTKSCTDPTNRYARHLHFQIDKQWPHATPQPYWPKYTNSKGKKVPYPSDDKMCPEIDDCLSDAQRQEAAAAVAQNTLNPMQLVENGSYQKDPWPMFQCDFRHSGYSRGSTISPPLRQGWTFSIAKGIIPSSPTLSNGTVFIGSWSEEGTVYAVDAIRGTERWRYPISGAKPTWFSSAAVWKDKVYITSTGSPAFEDAYLYALSAFTGSEIWRFRLGPAFCAGTPPSSPVIAGGIVYVGASGNSAQDNKLYAINAETKDLVWERQIVDPCGETRKWVLSSPAVTATTVIVGTWGSCDCCPTLFAFERNTGVPKWSKIVDAPYIFPAPSVANGKVFVRSGGAGWSGDLIALSIETGKEKWRRNIGICLSEGSPAVDGDKVYAGSGWMIHAFDAITGAEKWSVPALKAGDCGYGASIRFPFFAIADGTLFVKSDNQCHVARVYALSATNGGLLWNSGALGDNGAPGGADHSTPSVANGWLYFAIGNTLYAYRHK